MGLIAILLGKKNAISATRRKNVFFIAMAAVLLAIGLIFLTLFLIHRYETRKQSYSGAPVNYSEQLLFDTEDSFG